MIQPLYFNRAALAKLPTEYHIVDLSAVSPGMRGRGVRVKGLLDVAALREGSQHATFYSGDGKYSACLTLDQAREYGIVVYEVDGDPLPIQKGGPFRLITPGLGDLCANVKQVAKIEITSELGKDTRPSQACA